MAKRPAKPVKLANETKRLPVENLQKRPDKLKDVKDSKDNVVEVPAGFEPSATRKDHQQDFKNYKDGKDERPEIAQAISPRKPKGPKDKGEVEKAKPEGEKAQQKEIEKVKAEYEKAKEIDKAKPEQEKFHKEIDKVKAEFEKQVKEKEGKEIAETPVDPALREGAATRGDGDKDHFIAPGQRPDLSGGALTGEADKGKPAPKPPSPRKR